MGAAKDVQVSSDAVSVTAFSLLTSQDFAHLATCSCASAVRDEEAAGSNPATPTSSEGI
jgi:hypothetical protein